MKPEIIAILSIFVAFIVAEMIFTNFFKKKGQVKGDGLVELIGTLMLTLITQPLIVAAGFAVTAFLVPDAADMLKSWPVFAVFALFLIFDDMAQYWWHRITHATPWLYKLHRPHHQAEYLSIRIVYRNGIFYYFLMPSLWFVGALIYLGGGWVYAVYIVVKMTVIFGAHSDLRWDEPLYKIKWLSPVMWVVERTSRQTCVRRHYQLQRQLRQSTVFLGRPVRHSQNYAPVPRRDGRRKSAGDKCG
jgi:sterol desaturase/sphingolipid hydroxylase (fatty acid hydroxylase superfamily)